MQNLVDQGAAVEVAAAVPSVVAAAAVVVAVVVEGGGRSGFGYRRVWLYCSEQGWFCVVEGGGLSLYVFGSPL